MFPLAAGRRATPCKLTQPPPSPSRSSVLRLFKRGNDKGEFYTAHGGNALFVADEFFKTRQVVKYLGDLAGTLVTLPKLVRTEANQAIRR